MNEEQRLVQKRLRVLEHAQKTGNATATSASTTSESVQEIVTYSAAGFTNDLAITAMSTNPASPIATCGSNQNNIDVTVTVANEGSADQSNFFVQLSSNVADDPTFQQKQILSLASLASTDVVFNWNYNKADSCGLRTFAATAVLATDQDTDDNTDTLIVDIQ